MNNLNNTSVDDVVECPLCMEPLEVDDLNFFPCTCGYQICRFCWHRIRTDENELCPACRKEYPENPADFKPLTQDEMIAFKSQKRQRDQQRKQKITENRKHLANVRVVQKNLVFVVGLPPRLADADILKKHEYFGKYGKIHKVVINPSTTYAGVQGPSASAYVTYVNNTEALRAIQSVNNIMIDGRLIKTSLGTTKYCSHFMKNQQCPKADCMYLHELGDPEASFTKEEMHQGKHQEYEKLLHDVLIATSGASVAGGLNTTTNTSTTNRTTSCGGGHNSKTANGTGTGTTNNTATTNTSNSSSTAVGAAAANAQQQKEAWPSLSNSPVNQKDVQLTTANKSKKERTKTEKSTKTKKTNNNHNTALTKEVMETTGKSSTTLEGSLDKLDSAEAVSKLKTDKSKERNTTNSNSRTNQRKEIATGTIKEHEIKDFEQMQMANNTQTSNTNKMEAQRSLNSSSNSSNSGLMLTRDNSTPINDIASGKSSPNSLHESDLLEEQLNTNEKSDLTNASDHNMEKSILTEEYMENISLPEESTTHKSKQNFNTLENALDNARLLTSNIEKDIFSDTPLRENKNDNDILSDTLTKLNLFDENSFFTSAPSYDQSRLIKHKANEDAMQTNPLNTGNMPNLPDLISGIDGYQNNTNDWEEAFKNVMLKTNKQNLQHQQQQQQLLQNHHLLPHNQMKHHQEDLHRLQEMQKRNSLLSSFGLGQVNAAAQQQNEFLANNYLQNNFQHQFLQQQQQFANENLLQNSLFETNMSKFFDFHKNQQLQHGAGNLNPGNVNENLHLMSSLMEGGGNRLNSQLKEQNILATQQQQQQQQQLQKQKVFNKMDDIMGHYHQAAAAAPPSQTTHNVLGSLNTQQNQFLQNSSNADDDLGFDPFIETQKALAELIENEEEQQNVGSLASTSKLIPHKQVPQQQQQQQPQQQQHQQQMMDYMQRARMPPPGFNHVNNFGNYNTAPRVQNTSKIMPFMNLSNNYGGGSNVANMHSQPQLQIPSNAWSTTHVGPYASQLNEQQMRQVSSANPLQNAVNQKSYTGNDWTAMDPAILSLRQFSFPQQSQLGNHLQPQQQQQQQQHDMYLQQLAQQQQQQQPGFNSQSQQPGFNNQTPHLVGNVGGIPNTILNSQQQQQQNSQAQVNANVQGMLEYLKTRQFV